MTIEELLTTCAADNDFEIDLYDEPNQINESTTFLKLWQGRTNYHWLDAEIDYWNPDTEGRYMQISAVLIDV